MAHDHHSHDDNLSPSGHPYRADKDIPLTHPQLMEIALRELLIEKGIITAKEVSDAIEYMDSRSPAIGARVVAKSWVDSKFRAKLLADGSGACKDIGLRVDAMKLVAVENEPDVHNIVVCTLCSCYPRNLLGLPPDWYKERAYRSRTVREPRKVLAEFGVTLPESTKIRVHDSTADMRYLVIPNRPAGTENWNEDALAELVTRDSMIGVGLAKEVS